jgi:hypothetical protein
MDIKSALIQINRYDNEYRVKHIRQYFPTHYEEDSNDGISMISRKPHHKIDNIVPGSLDVRINRNLLV